jgi:hypothetical protein
MVHSCWESIKNISICILSVQSLTLENVGYHIVLDALNIFEQLVEFRAISILRDIRVMCLMSEENNLYRHFASYQSIESPKMWNSRIRSAPYLKKFCLVFPHILYTGTSITILPDLSDCHQLEELRLLNIEFTRLHHLTFLDSIPHLRFLELYLAEYVSVVPGLMRKMVIYRNTLEVFRIHTEGSRYLKIAESLDSSYVHLKEILLNFEELNFDAWKRDIDKRLRSWTQLESLIIILNKGRDKTINDILDRYPPNSPMGTFFEDRRNEAFQSDIVRLLLRFRLHLRSPNLIFQSYNAVLIERLQRWHRCNFPQLVAKFHLPQLVIKFQLLSDFSF